jgi:hypothetical protein
MKFMIIIPVFLLALRGFSQSFEWSAAREFHGYGKRIYQSGENIFVRGNSMPTWYTQDQFYISKFDDLGILSWSIDNIPEGRAAVSNDCIYVSKSDATTGKYKICKLDLSGNLQWEIDSGVPVVNANIKDIACDNFGGIYIVGGFGCNMTLGSFSLAFSGYQFFVAKLDSDGNYLWAQQSSSEGDGQIFQHINLKVSSRGSVYVFGDFFGPFNLGDTTFSHVGYTNGFVASYSIYGEFRWAYNAGSNDPPGGQEFITSVDEDSMGNTYAVGFYDQTFVFGSTILADMSGYSNAFIFKLDPTGQPLWAKSIDGAWKKTAEFVKVDHNDQVYVTGSFGDPVNFGSGVTLSNAGYLEPFLAKYDSTGTTLWAIAFGGGGTGCAIDITADNKILVSGCFGGTVDFGGHPQTVSSNSMFLTKISDSSSVITSVLKPQVSLFSTLSVSPNPGNAVFNISYSSNEKDALLLNVFDSKGQVVYSEKLSASACCTTVDLSGKAKGIYTIEIRGKSTRERQKLILQ